MTMRKILLTPFVLLPLLGCGPVPLAVAEQNCLEQARLAEAPQSKVSVAIDNHGNVSTGFEIGVSSDYLQGRDPAQVYDQCVYNAAGQMPSQPYYTLPKP
jgi:hypothetical protein